MQTPDIIRLHPDTWRGRPLGPGAFLLLQHRDAAAWGAAEGGRIVAAMQTAPAQDGLAVEMLWVPDGGGGQALAARFLHIAREQQRLQRLARLTVGAAPGLDQVFAGAGFGREGEQWMYALPRPAPLDPADVTLRAETRADYRAADAMVRDSFWNRYRPGCDEHLLTHHLRGDPAYVEALSRIALVDGEIAGGIWYAKAGLANGGEVSPVLLFGPLAAAPAYQRRGLGAMLVQHTMALARQAGWPGIVIMGDPGYYHRFGFRHAKAFGITLRDGSCPEALMAVAFENARLCKPGAVFVEPPVYEDLAQEDVLAFDRGFAPRERFWLPCQF